MLDFGDLEMLTNGEAAELLRIKGQTLRKWRLVGRGPVFTRIGGRVRYRKSDLEAFLAGHRFRSTAEETVGGGLA